MKHQLIHRAAGILLALISLFVSYVAMPAQAFADEARAVREAKIYADATDFSQEQTLEYSPLTGELELSRTESGKQFRREDGKTEAVLYPFPVHKGSDGNWRDIDNTLVPVKNEKGNVTGYKAKDGADVSFGASIDSEYTVKYDWKGHSVSWKFPGLVNASVEERPQMQEDADMELRFPEELSSGIVYESEDSRVSVRYVLTSYLLNEYITLKEKPEEEVSFPLQLNCEGLTPSLQEDGSVLFTDEADQTVFVMSSPVMYDSSNSESEDLKVRIEKMADGSYVYTLAPDMEWLLSGERVYPVVIDPDIKPLFNGSATDTYISASHATSNYSTKDRIKIGSTASGYDAMVYFNINTLISQLKAGDVIVEATVNLSRYAADFGGQYITAYPIVKNWLSPQAYTWNKFYALGNPVDTSHAVAMVGAAYGTYFNNFHITDLVRKWVYGIQPNYGIYLDGVTYTEYRSAEYNAAYSGHPYFSLIYVNTTGLEDRFASSSQSAGRAGSGSVNLFSGNFTWTHPDADIANGVLPVSLCHVYNTNDRAEDIGYGYGWRLNYSQQIAKVTLTNRTETATYYRLTDGDGTRHYYKAGGTNTYVNELDHDSTLTVSGTTVTVSDKGGNKLVFSCDSGANNGRLTSIEDANGNRTLISYASSTVTDMKITSVTEQLSGQNAGQSLTLTYTDGRLSSITSPDGLDTEYAYTSGQLTSVTYADGNSSLYGYTQESTVTDRLLCSAANIDGYTLSYTYSSAAGNTARPRTVASVTEHSGNETGQSLSFTYLWNGCKVADSHGRDTVYLFDTNGQTVCVRDTEGRAQFAAYNTGDRSVTQLKAVSKLQSSSVNLLKNGLFARSADWTLGTGASYYGANGYNGNRTMKLTAGAYITQSVSVTAGKTYTLSASVKGAGVSVLAGSLQSDATGSGTAWQKPVLRYTAQSSGNITVKVQNSGNSDAYIDYVQFEEGEAANRCNLIENPDFTYGTSQYYFNGSADTSPSGITDISGSGLNATHPSALDTKVYRIKGTSYNSYLFTNIACSGSAGDTFSFGGWCYSDAVTKVTQRVDGTSPYYSTFNLLNLVIEFRTSGQTVVNRVSLPFARNLNCWQYLCGSATASGSYDSVRLIAEYAFTCNNAYFDGLQLYREEFSQAYSYNSSGDLTGYKSLIGQQNSFTYDNSYNITSSTDPRGNTTSYTYDSKHNLLTQTSEEGVVTSNTYNSKGQATETTVGNSSSYIRSAAAYDAETGLTASVTDARGNSIQYGYDPDTRQNTTVTDPKGNMSTYLYGNAEDMLRLASLTSTGLGTVSYGYDTFGKLTEVTRGSTVYSLTYDTWNRSLETKVGNTALSVNTYDSYGRLSTVAYGNGFTAEYVYDELDRVKEILLNDVLTYEFLYNAEGDLFEQRNYRTHRASFFEYDHAGRCMSMTEKSFTGTGSSISYGSILSSYRYEYDVNNNLTKLITSVFGQSWNTVYTYDGDDRPLTVTFASGKVMTDSYDAAGRLTRQRLGLNSNYDTVLTYKAGANGSGTSLVDTYTNGNDDPFVYNYDANGNITEISQGTVSVSYYYNSANELIRENNGFTNETVTYSYDLYGNITGKNVYAYTTADDPGTPLQTISYGYTNSSWGDQLTSYNNQPISYDAMGNPTSYLGQTLTWEGKQLTAAGTNAYAYDENGLRVQKTTGSGTTDYFYNGSVLMGLTKGNDTLLFSYDQRGKVQAVRFNGTYYYYLRNGQGDIVKLIDNSGNTAVEYSYDTWGKQLSCTGTLAGTLGVLNPFRYRGYVYDEETQWYYLQSRYYDPETGRFLSADVMLSTGQGVLGHNTYAYCLNNPATLLDDNGTMPWSWLAFWGEVHKYVQEEIRDIYGYIKEKTFTEYSIRIDIIGQSAIWEVKSAGPASLLAGEQLNRYLSKLGEQYHPGSNIAPHGFTKTSKTGYLLYIFYWEDPSVPGLIKYVFSSNKIELKKELSKAGYKITDEAFEHAFEKSPNKAKGLAILGVGMTALAACYMASGGSWGGRFPVQLQYCE